MKKLIILGLLFSQVIAFGKSSDSFIVEISDQKIKVTSPLKKVDIVSIIIKNNTLEKIVSELRTETKSLKRFVLYPEGKEVIQVNYKKAKHIIYVPISPPFESVKLRFSEAPYEIPEKK